MNDTLKSTLLAMTTAALALSSGCAHGSGETATSTTGAMGSQATGQGSCGGQNTCGAAPSTSGGTQAPSGSGNCSAGGAAPAPSGSGNCSASR